MHWLRVYSFPLFVSVLIHGLLVALIVLLKPGAEAMQTPKAPTYVNATLVELKAKSIKKPKAVNRPKKIDLTKQRREAEARKQADIRKKAEIQQKKDEAVQKKKADELKKKKAEELADKNKQEAAKKKAQEEAARIKLEKERLAQQLDEEFLRELAAEEEQLKVEAQAMEASSYRAVIAQRIEQKWSRPPSARNGMQCVLKIRLVPTGKVIHVTVVKSSGNDAFDRSAVQAVHAVEQFHELKGIESVIFEKFFREITLLFRPEDRRL